MNLYRLKNSVKIDFVDNELMIVDMETGFVGKGNKCSYQVLSILKEAETEKDVIEELEKLYKEDQKSRIEKSVPHIIEWALQRNLLEEVK